MESIINFIQPHLAWVQAHQNWVIFASAVLQIAASAILGLFSFKGLTIEKHEGWTISGKPMTHVSVRESWVIAAKVGLILLLVGIALGALASLSGI